ncbi:putative halogenase [Mycena olivaceomarginata]|nr:putative halogenase [Mycena olivaceomarginata]
MPAAAPNMIPLKSKILVIGAGPGGSYAATVLAREGFRGDDSRARCIPAIPHRRIPSSFLPALLRFIGAEDKIKNHGFAEKLNQHKREGYTDFIATNPDNGSWNVVRSEFDEILLRHAAQCGATVCEGVKVKDIIFADGTPVAARWETKDGMEGSIGFDYLVDASGKQGLVVRLRSTRPNTRLLPGILSEIPFCTLVHTIPPNRHFNNSLRNVACWGYWRGASMYAPEGHSERNNAPWFEAMTDETGWCWFIPLHNGTVSVGVSLTAHYHAQLQLAPGLVRLLADGELISDIKSAGGTLLARSFSHPANRSGVDYSYSATNYAGPNYRLVGDAAAFIDPFFSSGVHLALTGALSAASSIAASIRKQCTEQEAAAFHDAKIGTSYTRFLLVVLGVYKQIKAQESPVFSDINEDNFDRAFTFLRPIIQGAADADPQMTERELQDTMDFCQHVFAPTDSVMVSNVSKKLGPEIVSPDAPIMSVASVMALAGNDEEARNVLLKSNARKPLAEMYGCNTAEVMEGFYVRMERGMLGLVRA